MENIGLLIHQLCFQQYCIIRLEGMQHYELFK